MNQYCQNLFKQKPLLHIIILFGIMFVGDFLSSLPLDFIFAHVKLPYAWMYIGIRSMVCVVVSYLLFRMYTKKVLQSSMEDFRIGKLSIKHHDILYGVFLPSFVIITFITLGTPFFNDDMPVDTMVGIILIALFKALKAGVIEEILFRGYIMKIIELKWNKYVVIIMPSFIFGLIHIPSLTDFNLESVFLLVCGGTLVGVMFSLVAYKNNSIWGSAFIHVIWNFVMISNILWIYPGKNADSAAVFSILLPSENPLLTGAGFGVEVSSVAMIGYAAICIFTLLGMRNLKRSIVDKTGHSRA